MTKDDVIRMADLVGYDVDDDDDVYAPASGRYGIDPRLERFAELVAAAEREACAKLCEELRDEDGYECWGTECAVAIRAKDMSTKSQNVDTSAECVHESDKSIHEIERITDINKRLVAAARELGAADDAHEWDDAWSKMCKIMKEIA